MYLFLLSHLLNLFMRFQRRESQKNFPRERMQLQHVSGCIEGKLCCLNSYAILWMAKMCYIYLYYELDA